jgi:hypothetical protein
VQPPRAATIFKGFYERDPRSPEMARAGLGIGHWVYPHGLSSSKVHPAPELHFGKDQKMKWLLFMTMLAGLILGSVIAAKASRPAAI